MSRGQYDTLRHIVKPLSNGGRVVALDTGATIRAEEEAMLQALHSRSTGGIFSHLEKLQQKGNAKAFMESYYVGYGDKSIGDCGTATVFIEGVSMLAAKAVQDFRLYSGQESSTRYVDFANQLLIDPLLTDTSRSILEEWRALYLAGQTPVRGYLRTRFPRAANEDEKTYEKAVRARSFDTLRGFLPAGASTNLAWHSNFRQFSDKLMLLRHHPLPEVREIAEAVEKALAEMYPSSFGHKRYEETDRYNAGWVSRESYFVSENPTDFRVTDDSINRPELARHEKLLRERPPKTDVPKHLSACGTLQFEFLLDYGSFRDLQRHRAVVQRMPLLSTNYGFDEWYLDELPREFRRHAEQVAAEQEDRIRALDCPQEVAQYYTAMGYKTTNQVTGDIPALVYLVELRSTRFVHPTLVERSLQMARELLQRFGPCGLVLHLDSEPHRFDIRRGEHDIVEKEPRATVVL